MTEVYKMLFHSESSQVYQCTSGDLISREENHIHIIKMVFRKAVKKLRNLASKNLAVSTSSANKQVSTKSVPHQSYSKSDDDAQFTNPANKRQQPEGEANKQKKSVREQRRMANK